MDPVILAVFGLVYLGMILGELPGLAIDRTGVALLGAIILVAAGRITPTAAWDAVDVPTIALLFGLMVVSAQFRLGGFYTDLTRRLAAAEWSPAALLGLQMCTAGVLSAILANDIVCLAMAPVLVEGCRRRGLNPAPFLIGLACASNIGSAATLIGNPQNMLIGQALKMSFAGYLAEGGPPALLGTAAAWWVIALRYARAWRAEGAVPDIAAPPLDRWQSGKGLLVTVLLMAAFLFGPWPRELAALAAAGVLLLSRRMASRDILGLVDWQLLVLFIGLFVVNHGLRVSGAMDAAVGGLAGRGLDVRHPATMFVAAAVLSNIVSNVPAVMLLLPSAIHPQAGAILALSSTLAGNLFIVGSIANIIVVDQAARHGVKIGWREHARIGVPVTLATLAIAAVWLRLRA